MDTDWCIMCNSHCNIPGAIYCSEECKIQDHLGCSFPTSPMSSSSSSSFSTSAIYSSKPILTSSAWLMSKVQLPPQQQSTLFYHRAPLPRYHKTGGSSKVYASTRNLRIRSKSLYVQ
ncbi:11776_t:CDS:2 [Scutellospora calospora]|uniref:11776_t:CDS:1 n=1 Tax=Scutellospora calospora TaxID=85575 RepID=A0ACA9KBD7_9GLOM|nr:11776_t:CDS:2 [Scutellospora calospora]